MDLKDWCSKAACIMQAWMYSDKWRAVLLSYKLCDGRPCLTRVWRLNSGPWGIIYPATRNESRISLHLWHRNWWGGHKPHGDATSEEADDLNRPAASPTTWRGRGRRPYQTRRKSYDPTGPRHTTLPNPWPVLPPGEARMPRYQPAGSMVIRSSCT